MDVAGPRLGVGVDGERVDVQTAVERVSIGRAQSVPPNGSPLTVLTMSSRRWRAERPRGAIPSTTLNRLFLDGDSQAPRPALVKATVSTFGSVARASAAIAAEARRGLSPGTPAIIPPPIDPDTSSATRLRVPAGSTIPNES
jgi:hypothetical protein